jgi:hypothetical protein
VYAILDPGTYYLVLDTYCSDPNTEMSGDYKFSLSVRERGASDPDYFNPYVLAAVDYLYAEYGLLGYDSEALTHDIPYGDYGYIYMTDDSRTMCVAAVMEVILTAMILYSEDTGDMSVFDFLPIESWQTHADVNHIRTHIWVISGTGSSGTADALAHFGMGENIPFTELKPGGFINLNRATTGHAVVFISFIDIYGHEYAEYNSNVIGFKYFSSQGGSDREYGGLDYRYAVFSDYGMPEMPYLRDSGVIYSEDQDILNTGMMWNPTDWTAVNQKPVSGDFVDSTFDADYFNGITTDDIPRQGNAQ